MDQWVREALIEQCGERLAWARLAWSEPIFQLDSRPWIRYALGPAPAGARPPFSPQHFLSLGEQPPGAPAFPRVLALRGRPADIEGTKRSQPVPPPAVESEAMPAKHVKARREDRDYKH